MILGVAALALFGRAARADVIIFNNTTNGPVGGILFNGTAPVGGGMAANVDIDDITFSPGAAGAKVTSFSFVADNFNAGAVSARPTVYFWAANGAGGAPGTLLSSLVLPVKTFPAGSTTLTSNLSGLVVPSNGKFWAGIGYDDDNGTTGITAAQLDALGGLVFDPPTVGSSDGLVAFFIPPANAPFNVNNPGVSHFDFGDAPPVNYGWEFTGVLAAPPTVPEPSSLALLSLGGLALAGWRRWKGRRATA